MGRDSEKCIHISDLLKKKINNTFFYSVKCKSIVLLFLFTWSPIQNKKASEQTIYILLN